MKSLLVDDFFDIFTLISPNTENKPNGGPRVKQKKDNTNGMKRNLLIDIGNSSAKIAVAALGDTIVNTLSTEENLSVEKLESILAKNQGIDAAILCTTRNHDPSVEKLLSSKINRFIILGSDTPIPLKNLYRTPETLGPDRIAAAVGAVALAPERSLLVVDLGSAITIDTVTSAGEYLGGNISPGMTMRFKALHQATEKLPLYSAPQEIGTMGDNTKHAIQNGVALGILYEIEGYIARAERLYGDLDIFFTGRDAFYFADKLKKPIFATCDLVLSGLNRIIEYNAK